VGSKLSITEEEGRQYYARHPEEFTDAASITLREIFIEVPDAGGGVNVAKDDEAKKQIEIVRARALKGEDFGKLAAEISTSRSQAIIEWKNPELKKAYDKQVNAPDPVGGGQ